ncbi:MAG TPA: rhomboid family intramembrane serine protease [Blastocatellia bacterium]|nr:rhomboid family intramembrane serine protease [Blastocatellia bacterium]
MLLPIGDDNQGRLTTPFVVYAIIAVNVLVFLLLQQAGMTPQGERFTYGYAVVPYEITTGEDLTGPVVVRDSGATANGPRSRMGERPAAIPEAPGPSPIYLTLLTAMFMHGGWMHILGNMLYLWIFGDNVEDNFGHGKFIIFYLICGLAASFAQIAIDPSSPIPSLGASGAIAGVLGAYIVMFPHNRVRTLVPLFIIFTTIELPALVVIGLWIVLQVISQYTTTFSHTTQASGVAYMAHIGGFITGLLLSFVFRSRQRRRNLPPFYDPYQR